MRTTLALATIVVLLLEIPSAARQPAWKMSATVAESCSCTVSCPCNFGGEPSRTPCEGNRLISITSGRYEDVDLGGVAFLVTFNMRSWSKIYVSDKVSDRQMKAVEALLPLAFAGFHKGMLSFTKALVSAAASMLPRFASSPIRDPRAPQNLLPVGALEQEMKRRLGDPLMIRRAIEKDLLSELRS